MGSKLIAYVGGIIGLVAVLMGLIEPSLGWWQMRYEFGPFDVNIYINAFGYSSNTANNNVELVDNTLLLAGMIYLAGTLLLFIATAKNMKAGAFLCAILMIIGIILFCYGLYGNEGFGDLLSGMEFLSGEEHNVFFGTFKFLGTWTWRLGNGFFIGVVGAVIGLIGAVMMDKR